MTRVFTALLACAAIALVAAGCGGSSKPSGTSTTTGSSSPSTSAAPASGGGGAVQIKMQNIAFSPASATVKVGQKVTWVNEDTVSHNITSQSGDTIKSPDFGHGGTFSFTPTKAGTIKYVCTLHPGMNGTLTVTK
jgi:plastocyanin